MENQEINLDEMRNQIAILRKKLDRQEIVSDRLLRDTMRTKVSDINKTKRFEYECCAICIIAYPLTAYFGLLEWPFVIASCVMILFCLISTIYMHRPVDRVNLMTEDLTTVARIMDRFKRQYDFWLRYITPSLIIPWLAWACYEYAWKNAPEGINPLWFCLPLIAGVAIGGYIGYTYHRKASNAAKRIREQITEGK